MHVVALMDHKAAAQLAIWGLLGAAVAIAFAFWTFKGSDAVGLVAAFIGVCLIGVAIDGVVNLFEHQPRPSRASFACSLPKGPHDLPVVTATNVGTNLLVIDQVYISFLDSHDHIINSDWASPFTSSVTIAPHQKRAIKIDIYEAQAYYPKTCRVIYYQGPRT